MIILLYGQDSYRRLTKQFEIEKAYREKRGNLSEEHFDLSLDGTMERFKDFIVNRSMFDDMKLTVLENAYDYSDNKEFREILYSELETKSLIILMSADGKPPAKLNFLLKKPVQNQIFQPLEDAKLEFFINKEALSRGLKLSADIIESVKNTFGSDTWGIITELDKMAFQSNHFKPHKPKVDYYVLVSALKANKDFKHKLVALEIMLSERRDDPARVFNSLSYRLNSRKEAQAFADYDVAVKSGKLDYEEVLVDFCLSA